MEAVCPEMQATGSSTPTRFADHRQIVSLRSVSGFLATAFWRPGGAP